MNTKSRQGGPIVDDAKELRKQCGVWLKGLRERAGKTQLEVSKALGYDYYTFVSQLEGGKGAIPQDKYEAYAKVLGVDPEWFGMNLLRYYNPYLFKLVASNLKGLRNED